MLPNVGVQVMALSTFAQFEVLLQVLASWKRESGRLVAELLDLSGI